MFYLRIFLFAAIIALSACGSSGKGDAGHRADPLMQPLPLAAEHQVYLDSGDFAHDVNARQFIDQMVRQYNFPRWQLVDIFSQVKRLDKVIRLMDSQAPAPTSGVTPKPDGAWLRYRQKFITPANVRRGVQFWDQYQQALADAQRRYGVPAEMIVGILGVETRWGQITGDTRVIDALATLAFAYPRRADYFRQELAAFLLMVSKEGRDPLEPRGSFAGAMGYGQFMPSSYQQYAVDFDGDGHADLWNPVDVIGSVAHYFQQHGWLSGQLPAIIASGDAPTLAAGFNTQYTPQQLAQAGLIPAQPVDSWPQVSLLRLDMGKHYQYWYGLPNFYVITRYNHSTYYAMAVWQLGQAVARARDNASDK